MHHHLYPMTTYFPKGQDEMLVVRLVHNNLNFLRTQPGHLVLVHTIPPHFLRAVNGPIIDE
jgi:hypothetical protein